MSPRPLTLFIIVAGLLIAQGGCSQDQGSQAVTSPEADPGQLPVKKKVAVSAEAALKLEQADRLDGDEDHLIKNCYSCALSMPGKKEHSLIVDSFEAHFCSQHCCDHFADDAEKVIVVTTIPE